MTLVHIGLDSTDSREKGMCTTYLGTVLIKRLLKRGVTFADYPHLIRLNPNIPYKTRGNGAVVIRIEIPETHINNVYSITQKTIEEFAIFSDPQTNPGIAVYTGEVPNKLYQFYQKALHRLLTVKDAEKIAHAVNAQVYGYKNKRGIIGALAGIGEPLQNDHTYELIMYRKKEKWGTKRSINEQSVIQMDKKVEDTFFNYDYTENTMCISPHSVCPVLAGIRGETPESVIKAASMVDYGEAVSEYVVFCTNQHTNFHFETVSSVSWVAEYSSVILSGTVKTIPVIIRGGHVFFELENQGIIQCAAFEPTKKFRDVVRKLLPGDTVRVYGGVKRGGKNNVKTINLERLDILDIKTREYANPVCPHCGKSMTSKGKGKGYACTKCKITQNKKEMRKLHRDVSPGVYEPPPSAWRHLYKMVARDHTKCKRVISLIDGWIG
ncbi:MAG: tRNA(Ile)(2)-agmatinylcytidine synthase [Candidatus Methanofastidiosia archaeon]|jgi:tRNA(Ile2)-agmatinylcytidine synthase